MAEKKLSFLTIGAIALVRFYQTVLSSFLKQGLGIQAFCRYSPTCSEYAITVLKQYGILYGSYLTIKRVLSCQPFSKNK